jgi:hypothetical protein
MIQSFTLYYLRLMDVLLKSVQHNLSMNPFSKLSVSMLLLSTILIFDFGMFPTVWYLFVFHFILTVPFHFISTVPFHFISTVPLSLQGAHLYIFVSYIHNIDFFAALFVVI